MASILEDALRQYLLLIRSVLEDARNSAVVVADPHVLRSRDEQLASLVHDIEQQAEFQSLVRATGSEFSKDELERTIQGFWEEPVRNFFRIARVYQDLFDGNPLDLEAVVASYQEQFSHTLHRVTYLAPLEFVEFAEERLDCGDFEIRSFESQELDDLFGANTNRIFYPSAVVDSEKLSAYWFVVCHENSPWSPSHDFEIGPSLEVGFSYSRFPRPLEKVFQRLALYDYEDALGGRPQVLGTKKEIDTWASFARFNVPFVIAISDSLLVCPKAAPDTSVLVWEPYFDGSTRQSLGETNPIESRLEVEETRAFQNFIVRINALLKEIEPALSEWRFVEVGLGFLVKAFFSDFSTDMEQLLWHMAAVEAVLGEEGRGVTDRLSGRISRILAGSEEEAKQIRRQFSQLWKFRCRLVHGSAKLEANEVQLGHLGQARDTARRVVLWMLCYLNHIHKTVSSGTRMPDREEVLLSLDLGHPDRALLPNLLANLPDGFPHVPEWLD